MINFSDKNFFYKYAMLPLSALIPNHLPLVMHMNQTSIGSDNGLVPNKCPAII